MHHFRVLRRLWYTEFFAVEQLLFGPRETRRLLFMHQHDVS